MIPNAGDIYYCKILYHSLYYKGTVAPLKISFVYAKGRYIDDSSNYSRKQKDIYFACTIHNILLKEVDFCLGCLFFIFMVRL